MLEVIYQGPHLTNQFQFSLPEGSLLILYVIHFALILLQKLCIALFENSESTQLLVFLFAVNLRSHESIFNLLQLRLKFVVHALDGLALLLKPCGSSQHS